MKTSLRFLILSCILLTPILEYSQAAHAQLGGTYTVEGDYIKATCSCKCNGKDLASSAIYKKGTETATSIARILGTFNPIGVITGPLTDMAMTQLESYLALYRCQDQCARSCGGFTTCAEPNEATCGTCCNTFCTDSSKGYGGELKDSCLPSCKSTCAYQGTVKGITELIYEVAGVIAALMIVIQGVRMVTAQDPSDRTAAKNSIIYIFLALIIIILAATVVGLFLKPGMIPGT